MEAMRPLRIIGAFVRASAQEELAYRANFWISLLHSLLNLAVGVLGLQVIFSQVDSLRGWNRAEALALLGVYLLVGALRGLFIGPGMEALVGLGQEVWSGAFDFTLLRPVATQFLVTFHRWRLFALLDLVLGLGVLGVAVATGSGVSLTQVGLFLLALLAALVCLYATLLAFTALVFWNPGYLFTWVFDALFQLARYPVSIYPAWLRFGLTWLIPVGVMTTIPAGALTGRSGGSAVLAAGALALALLLAASWLFSRALRRYSSASS